ncbi:hypothetical protein pipiens_010662 [Culex pipiens pipiens]|uniref:Uncharacterized protein n=1 Tax=Culex pipiens pipiens TaxID=38569 RepID=A0ABD1D9C8_CULPP
MKPTDLYLLPVLLAVLMATPSDGQVAATTADLIRQVKPMKTMMAPEPTEGETTEEPAKLEPSTVSGEGTTVGQGIAEESVTVQAEIGVNGEDSSEEEDEEVVDENSATEEVDETKKE